MFAHAQLVELIALPNTRFGISRLTSEFMQYHQKASVKIQHIGRENSNHTLARCVFCYQHCFTKVIDTYCRDEKHGKQLSINTIGKKKHTLVTENTPHCHKLINKKGM
jgi:hypothetical protein